MQMRFRKSHFSDPDRPNHLVNSVHVFAWIWDQTQAQFWDPDRPNHLVYSVFACICMIGAKPRFSFEILILQTSWFTVNLHDFGAKSTLILPKGEHLA